MKRRIAALLGLLAIGCFAPVKQRCASCFELRIKQPPAIATTTRTVFVLVPGLLGYGWEWDGAQAALAQYPAAAVRVYTWDPWQSLATSSGLFAAHLHYLKRRLPPSVQELVVIAHSAAGLVAVAAASQLQPRPETGRLRIRVLVVGAPLAGMGRNPWGGKNMWHTPLPIALGSRFGRWPEPAAHVTLNIYQTSIDDPVMKPTLGHDPGDWRVLPERAQRFPLPRTLNHNHALTYLCEGLLKAALDEKRR